MPIKKETTTIQKEVEMDTDDSPHVVAYRVKKLEDVQKESIQAQREGFEKLSGQLQEYKDTFVSQTSFAEAKVEADREHAAIRTEIKDLRDFKDKIVTRLAVGAILFLVAVVVVDAGLEKYVKF